MPARDTIGKSFVLLLLILILVFLGLFWFDYLGVIQVKQLFSPAYRLIGLEPQTSVSANSAGFIEQDLDDDRLAKRLAALDTRSQELEKRREDIAKTEAQNKQIAQELEDRRFAQEEREKAFTNATKQYTDREKNIESNSQKLVGMPPQNAVAILIEMDDQDIIDIIRKTDEIAAATGQNSITAFWFSLMPAARAAQIQRKMANKPASIE